MTPGTAIIYIPAYHPDDGKFLADCERLAHASGITITLPLRDVATVDWVLASGWADIVIVARPHHEIVGWPVRVASDVANRQGATVVGLPRTGCGGRHRAPNDSLIGRVVRHPTVEMPLPKTSAYRLIDNRVKTVGGAVPLVAVN